MKARFKALYVIAALSLPVGPLTPGLAMAAEDFDTLYRTALEARYSGDFAAARDYLERALALKPDHVEALYHLGLVRGFQKDFRGALETLSRALALAPGNMNVRIATARIKGWSGRLAEAIDEAKGIVEDAPANVEARNLLGRLFYYREDLDAARAAFKEAARLAPSDPEAEKGLADVRRAQEAKLLPEPVEDFRWRLDAGYTGSEFSRSKNKGWHEGNLQLSYGLTGDTKVHARVERSRRFGLTDTYLRTGIDYRFLPWLRGYARIGATPSADFLPRWTADAGGSVRIKEGGEWIGTTLLTLDLRQRHYVTGDIRNGDPGVQIYFFDGWAWATGKWINSYDVRADKRLTGWSGRGDWQVVDGFRVFAGMSRSPETDLGVTVDTLSRFAGLNVDITPEFGVNLAYTRDNRKGSYIRNVVSAGLTFRF